MTDAGSHLLILSILKFISNLELAVPAWILRWNLRTDEMHTSSAKLFEHSPADVTDVVREISKKSIISNSKKKTT